MELIKSAKWAFGLLVGVMLFAPIQQAKSVQSQPSANVTDATSDDETRGEKIYAKKGCNYCHSNVGQGSSSGKRLASPVLLKEQFFAIVRRPYGIMPAYSPEVLSDQELGDIYQYLKSLESPKVEDIDLLQRESN